MIFLLAISVLKFIVDKGKEKNTVDRVAFKSMVVIIFSTRGNNLKKY